MKLLNKTILITGGSSGIGRALAEGLLKEGARVGVLSRRSPNQWEESMPDSWKPARDWINADFKSIDTLQTNLRKWLSTVNHINTLIHCAVTYESKSRHPFEETSLEEWENLFAVNTFAAFVITKEVLPYIEKAKKGQIIGLVTDVAFIPGAGRIGYAASKSAFHSMLIGLAEEKKGTGVNIVEILPKDQVHTPGIQQRRPVGYNFNDYASPNVFLKPVVSVINSTDDSYNGMCIIVDKDGKYIKK